MATETRTSTLTPALQRRIEEHKKEMARYREEFGDPEVALSALLQSMFDPEIIQQTLDERQHYNWGWLEDEENWIDNETTGDDAR